MYIRVKRNGVYSEWFHNTKKIHRALITDPPEAVEIRVEDLYPASPQRHEAVEVSLKMFNVLTRESILEENRYQKRLERYHDGRSLEEIDRFGDAATANVEEEYIQREQLKMVCEARTVLTQAQWRRLKMRVIDGMSYMEIATVEDVKWQTVQDSVELAWKKIKNILV